MIAEAHTEKTDLTHEDIFATKLREDHSRSCGHYWKMKAVREEMSWKQMDRRPIGHDSILP
jgi:hypothetical protein